MTSYLRSWLVGTPATNPVQTTQGEYDDDSEDGSETETEQDRDVAPVFPSINSAQRAKSSVPKVLTDEKLMPPPPAPHLAVRTPGVPSRQPVSSSSSLGVAVTMKPPTMKKTARAKVALAPGHSPLDWAKLKSSGEDLRGVDELTRIPPSILKQHKKKDDAWTVINGKVYNMTAYLPFHPGGEKELMRVAGRDGTKLFMDTHSWVNAEMMLDGCLVGFLVSEPS